MHTLRDINLNLLVVLRELLIERSVTRAAEKLAMSQSAVSHALARLRDILEDALFIQTKTGIKPTAKALELQEDLEKALYHANEVLNGFSSWEPASMKRTFRIAMSDYGAYLLLPALLARIQKVAPGVDLICSPSEHQQIALQLSDRSIHLGCCVADSVYKDLCVTPLFTDRLICLVDRDSKLAATSQISLKAYASSPHMVVSSSGIAHSAVDTFLAKKGLHRRVAVVLPHYTVASKAVVGTDMILTLPCKLAHSLPERSQLRFFEPPVPPEAFTYSMVWHPRSQEDSGHLWLRKMMAELGEELCNPQ